MSKVLIYTKTLKRALEGQGITRTLNTRLTAGPVRADTCCQYVWPGIVVAVKQAKICTSLLALSPS